MDSFLPVVHSTLAAGPLIAALWPDYSLPPPTGCHLLHSGFNDHYFVATPEGDYALRVYHHGWRTAEEVAFELAALTHLQSRGVPVCGPIARRDGAYQYLLTASEGPRLAALIPLRRRPRPGRGGPRREPRLRPHHGPDPSPYRRLHLRTPALHAQLAAPH